MVIGFHSFRQADTGLMTKSRIIGQAARNELQCEKIYTVCLKTPKDKVQDSHVIYAHLQVERAFYLQELSVSDFVCYSKFIPYKNTANMI